jgi:hypothetical protein
MRRTLVLFGIVMALGWAPGPARGTGCCPADIDGDGAVCQSDLGTFLGAFYTCTGQSGFVPGADLDKDGCIDQSDLGLLLKEFGCGCPPIAMYCAGGVECPLGLVCERGVCAPSGKPSLEVGVGGLLDPTTGLPDPVLGDGVPNPYQKVEEIGAIPLVCQLGYVAQTYLSFRVSGFCDPCGCPILQAKVSMTVTTLTPEGEEEKLVIYVDGAIISLVEPPNAPATHEAFEQLIFFSEDPCFLKGKFAKLYVKLSKKDDLTTFAEFQRTVVLAGPHGVFCPDCGS